MKRWLLLALLSVAGGCVPVQWDKAKIEPKRFSRRQQVKIWSADSVLRWHAVIITSDSISGIPHKISSKCDSCRVSLPRSAVSRIRLRQLPSPRDDIILTAFMWAYGIGHLSRGNPR